MTNIPYTTLFDIVNKKSKFENCSIKTIYNLSIFLNIPISELIANELEYRMAFEQFRSEICHKLKEMGDKNFLKYIYKNNIILDYYYKSWYKETYYTLALTDYISKENNLPIAKEYNFLRTKKLDKKIYPRDVNIISKLDNNKIKTNANEKAISEFLKYNIVETNVRDVY